MGNFKTVKNRNSQKREEKKISQSLLVHGNIDRGGETEKHAGK